MNSSFFAPLRSLALGLLALAALGASAQAGTLKPPAGAVVLTVTGKIGETNAGASAQFDMGMLEAMPGRVTETETPWTKGRTRFEGPLGAELLDAVGAKGEMLHIVALNDYAVDVPLADFRKWPVILATRKDGQPMAVRDKGPIFVIYPFDADPSLYNETYFARSAWQVKSIEVR